MSPEPPAGDGVDQDELVREHLPLVTRAVARVAARVPRHVSRDELTSAALCGLVQAARSFCPERGVPFSHYADRRIHGALLDELRSADWASRGVRAAGRRVDTATEQLTRDLRRTPTQREIAVASGLTVAALRALEADRSRAVVLRLDVSGSDPSSEQGGMARHTRTAWTEDTGADDGPEMLYLAAEERQLLHRAITALPDRLRVVVERSFLQECSLREVADELGVTESRVSQMRSEAVAWLREGLETLGAGPIPISAPDSGPEVGHRAARQRAAYRLALSGTTAA